MRPGLELGQVNDVLVTVATATTSVSRPWWALIAHAEGILTACRPAFGPYERAKREVVGGHVATVIKAVIRPASGDPSSEALVPRPGLMGLMTHHL